MRILFISGNLCDGGAQRVISVVSSTLAEKGHEVSLFLYSRNEKEYPISDKVKISSISLNYEDYCKVSAVDRIKLLRKHIKSFKPQVAVGFLEGGYGLFIASLGLKMAKVSSSRIDPKYIMSKPGIRGKIDRMWFESSDAVVLQTEGQRARFPESIGKKGVVIPNPISDRALSMEKESYEGSLNFVMAGRLAEEKNYPMVFRAVALLKEKYPALHVDIFGKGGEKDRLLEMLKELNLEDNITLRGWTQDTLGEYIKRDAYIMSSSMEGMPNALMEAMAVGLPCISTDCPTGPYDLITDGENGYLVPVEDEKALAEKMEKIITMSAEERKALGKNARSSIRENYTSEIICKKWEQLFETLSKR